jgi:hypothetical protein
VSKIRNGHGDPIPCCWSDCTRDADTANERRVPHDDPKFPGELLIYAFCSPVHAMLWSASSTGRATHGNLLPGQRSPLGLILP